ncbi:MAG: MFS transporter [Parasporobacterium sp.]|nr:MFS transporter [Parasporobacterium sp.]
MQIQRVISFVIIAIAYCFVQFHRNSTGVIKGELSSFITSDAAFGTLSSMYFYPYMLMQIPIGALLDMIGTRKTVSIGCAFAAAGSLIFGTSQSFAVACIGRVLIGIGVSAPVVSMQKFITNWFPERRTASAFSTASLIGYSGALLAQYPLAWLIEVVSWRAIFLVCVGISAATAILCWIFVKDTPKACGFPSIAELEGRAERPRKSLTISETIKAIGRTFANRYVWPLLVICMIHQGLQGLFSATWAVPYLTSVYQMSKMEATGYTSAMMAGMILFGFTVGKISDRIRSRKIVLAFISGMMAVLWACLAYGPNRFMSVPLLWVVMFLMGMSGTGIQIIFAYSREVNDPGFVGVAVTAVNFAGMLCSAFMPTLAGVLLDKYKLINTDAISYQKTFTICVILSAVAFIMSVCLKETHCVNRYYDFVKPGEKKETN